MSFQCFFVDSDAPNLFQIYNLLQYPKDSLQNESAEIMLRATNDERGTVAGLRALSEALEEEHADGTLCFNLPTENETSTPRSQQVTYHTALVQDANADRCHLRHTAFSLTPSTEDSRGLLFTAVQRARPFPTACLSTGWRHSSNTLSSKESGITRLAQSCRTGRPLSKSPSRLHLRSMHTERSSKFSSLTRTSVELAVRCGSPKCDGSRHGLENATKYGMICE
jgi:hypothetical protein